MRWCQLDEPILNSFCGWLCIFTLIYIYHISMWAVKMKVTRVLDSAGCAFSSLEFFKPDFSCDQHRGFESEHKLLKCCRFHCESCKYEHVFFWSDVSLLGNVGSLMMWYFCYCSTRKTVLKQIASNNKRDNLKEKKAFLYFLYFPLNKDNTVTQPFVKRISEEEMPFFWRTLILLD